jgi:hypothetical protein
MKKVRNKKIPRFLMEKAENEKAMIQKKEKLLEGNTWGIGDGRRKDEVKFKGIDV